MRTYFLAISILCAHAAYANFNDSSQYYVKSGLLKKQTMGIQAAIEDFKIAYTFDNTDTAAVSNYADALYLLRKYSLALEKYKELIGLGSQSATALRQLFNLSFNFRRFDDAIKFGLQLKEAYPDERVMFVIGKSYQALEDYANALPALDKAMIEEPGNGDIPYTKARIYTDMQNMKAATDMYKKAIELEPDNYDWMYEAAIAFYESGDGNSSLRYMEMSADKGHPLTSDFKLNLAIAYKNVGRLNDAAAKLDELLKKKPSDVEVLTLRAKTTYQKRNYDSTIYYLNQVLAADDKNADALYMIGLSYRNKGDETHAFETLEKAYIVNPSLKNRQGRPLNGY